jgi:intracellular multiplication protein IcmP
MAEQKADQSNEMLVLVSFIVIVLALFYYFFSREIKLVYLTLKLWELKIITMFYPSEFYLKLIDVIETTPISKWKFIELIQVGKYVGFVLNIPFMLLIGYLAYNVWTGNPIQKFKRILNMQTLKEAEQKLWPYITPMVNVDLMNEPFDTGMYAMGLRPYDFAVKYKLLLDEKLVSTLDKVKAEKLFVSQVGKLWDGFDKLKKHEKALLLIFAAQACGDKKGALDAVNAIAISCKDSPKKPPDFSSTKDLVKYLDNPKVKNVISKHAYVYTVMMAMLEFARTTGVLPSSYITWLKTRDRVLWYVLNSFGRQTPYIEAAGIFGHFKAEEVANHKLEVPYVINAVDGLEKALAEVKIVSK